MLVIILVETILDLGWIAVLKFLRTDVLRLGMTNILYFGSIYFIYFLYIILPQTILTFQIPFYLLKNGKLLVFFNVYLLGLNRTLLFMLNSLYLKIDFRLALKGLWILEVSSMVYIVLSRVSISWIIFGKPLFIDCLIVLVGYFEFLLCRFYL